MYSTNTETFQNSSFFQPRYFNRKKDSYLNLEYKAKKLINDHLENLKKGKSDVDTLNITNAELKLYNSENKEINTSNYPTSFKQMSQIPNIIQENIEKLQFNQMTSIQKLSIPIILEGIDLVGCAQTGSGKTLAYLLPLSILLYSHNIPIINQKKKISYPLLLIIVPTRELAIQIYQESLKILYQTQIIPVCVYGGEDYLYQIADLREGCDILIGTPGRLIHFLEKDYISLDMCKFLVIDEADKMMDMGFEPDIRKIIYEFDLSDDRQTLMFSATFPKIVLRIMETFLKEDFYFINTGNFLGENESANANVEQRLFYIKSGKNNDKLIVLHKILQIINGKTLVFVNTKRDTSGLKYFLDSKNYNVNDIHGDKTMEQRKKVLNDFIKGKLMLLIATDVASRGLDIPHVDYVINFDLPNNIDSYVHRIGRTGRCGKEGKAFSLVMPSDYNLFKDLYNILKKCNQKIPQFIIESLNY
jgi:ATP-dependent RNA helicase DDX3X